MGFQKFARWKASLYWVLPTLTPFEGNCAGSTNGDCWSCARGTWPASQVLSGLVGSKVWPLMVTITGIICMVVVVVPLLVNGLSPTIMPVNFWPFDPARL